MPNCGHLHTPQPISYMAWHNWAEKMSKTHKQQTCPKCGLWEIWVPKRKRKSI